MKGVRPTVKHQMLFEPTKSVQKFDMAFPFRYFYFKILKFIRYKTSIYNQKEFSECRVSNIYKNLYKCKKMCFLDNVCNKNYLSQFCVKKISVISFTQTIFYKASKYKPDFEISPLISTLHKNIALSGPQNHFLVTLGRINIYRDMYCFRLSRTLFI